LALFTHAFCLRIMLNMNKNNPQYNQRGKTITTTEEEPREAFT